MVMMVVRISYSMLFCDCWKWWKLLFSERWMLFGMWMFCMVFWMVGSVLFMFVFGVRLKLRFIVVC